MTSTTDPRSCTESEWKARRWMHMRGARNTRQLMRKARRAGLPGAAAHYERQMLDSVKKARHANHAALWHARNA